MDHCLYYQAQVKKELCWFFVGTLRSYEHMAFDRTVDKKNSIFELLVPELMKNRFETLMNYYQKTGIITSFELMENRLLQPGQEV